MKVKSCLQCTNTITTASFSTSSRLYLRVSWIWPQFALYCPCHFFLYGLSPCLLHIPTFFQTFKCTCSSSRICFWLLSFLEVSCLGTFFYCLQLHTYRHNCPIPYLKSSSFEDELLWDPFLPCTVLLALS